jgi:hypothetical protein
MPAALAVIVIISIIVTIICNVVKQVKHRSWNYCLKLLVIIID